MVSRLSPWQCRLQQREDEDARDGVHPRPFFSALIVSRVAGQDAEAYPVKKVVSWGKADCRDKVERIILQWLLFLRTLVQPEQSQSPIRSTKDHHSLFRSTVLPMSPSPCIGIKPRERKEKIVI